jgi:hypothetical protein
MRVVLFLSRQRQHGQVWENGLSIGYRGPVELGIDEWQHDMAGLHMAGFAYGGHASDG